MTNGSPSFWFSPQGVPVQGGEECVVCNRARQQVAGFVINRERRIDRFDIMIRADIAIAVWWRASAELGCSTPLKGQQSAPALWASAAKYF